MVIQLSVSGRLQHEVVAMVTIKSSLSIVCQPNLASIFTTIHTTCHTNIIKFEQILVKCQHQSWNFPITPCMWPPCQPPLELPSLKLGQCHIGFACDRKFRKMMASFIISLYFWCSASRANIACDYYHNPDPESRQSMNNIGHLCFGGQFSLECWCKE